jgi:SAM-dependent methyltransferase
MEPAPAPPPAAGPLPVGFDEAAYSAREAGLSPDWLRDGVWTLIEPGLRGSVLDAGSGRGGWIRRLQARRERITRLASVDIVDSGASSIEGVEFHCADLSNDRLPFDDASFDWVFALEVIEHLANPRRFVTESFRVLKPNGRLFLTTPSNDCIRSRLSLLTRGYYPAFNDRDYRDSGHITPILEIDLRRMAVEAKYARVEFFFPLDGFLPKLGISWQRIFPKLRGKLWSDSLFCQLTK